ncbi:hypothetical protein ABZ543_12990 [Streptomyces roseifaciens]
MADTASIIKRIRSEIGDFASPFLDTFLGGDELSSYDLSQVNVREVTATVTTAKPPATTVLTPETDYVLDVHEGRIVLLNPVYSPLHHGQTMVVRGSSDGMFTDADLQMYIDDAMNQHTYGRQYTRRYKDQYGFIRYWSEPYTLDNLPKVEEPLVAYLAAINVLWTLATDAATDIDISTAEGTFVPRTQRYRQLMQHIGDATSGLQGRYNQLAQQLNVGLGRIEMFTLRRVSRTTNRLVPIFRAREYDDASMPERLLPPIDGDNYADTSGIPSPLLPGVWG